LKNRNRIDWVEYPATGKKERRRNKNISKTLAL
jgi:hypothetical protein